MASHAKTIEDYRNAVKLLKLKVIKQQKQTEELQEKLREQGIPFDSGPMQEDLNNQTVMLHFSRSCKRLGLTPEMLFRAADSELNNEVQSENFRLFLSKVRLGLTPAQLTLLIRVFDEDCSGIVKKESYCETLQAYGINEEKPAGMSRTFGQEAMLKFARILIETHLSVEESFLKISSQNPTPSQFLNFVRQVDHQCALADKEIVAVFNHIDINKNGTIKREFYEQEVRKAVRAASNNLGITTRSGFKEPIREENPFAASKNKEFLRPPQDQMSRVLNDSISQQVEPLVMISEDDRRQQQLIVTKLKSQGIDAIEFVKKVIRGLEIPSAGVLLYDFFKNFDKNIQKSTQLQFFEALDLTKNGSISYDELMVFFFEFKSPNDPYDGLFEILARKLQALEISIQKYLALEQIYDSTMLTADDFHPLAQILFNTPSKIHSDKLFKYMDVDQSGILSAGEIIQTVSQIQNIYSPIDEFSSHPFTTNCLSTITLRNVDEYFKVIMLLKPQLSDDDFFHKFKQVGSGKSARAELQPWKTIFTSDIACLRFVYELVQELEKNPGSKWSDPEFGPSEDDTHGSKSMYFAENEIPEGSPRPEECEWLRPEEMIAKLIEDGSEDLVGKKIEFFDAEGAGASDVMQSKYLGNCWFISALTILSGYDQYLNGNFDFTEEEIEEITDENVQGMMTGVYPPCFHFLAKYGIYVMRFFKNFGWKYVVIDDRMCVKDREYVFGNCRAPTELWVNLIEKAYAKLHQCYQALTSGDIAQGLADMTGKTPDKIKIRQNMAQQEKENLWNLLIDSKKERCMMGCSAEGGTELYIQLNGIDTGLMSGHAYGILDIFEIPDDSCKNYHKSHRLLKLMNPWGYGEWKLKWSEEPDQFGKLEKHLAEINNYYDQQIKAALLTKKAPPERYVSGVDDGIFLINYKSWRTVFSNLFQCIDFPEHWSGLRCFDRFGLQTSGAPSKQEASLIAYAQKNPQYIVDIKRKKNEATTLYVQMAQSDGRLFWCEQYPYEQIMKLILVCVFQLDGNQQCLPKFDKSKMIASSEKLNLRREVDTNEFQVQNGRYVIIPCTKEAGQSIEFTISVYFDCPKDEIKITKYGDTRFKFGPIAEEEEEVAKAPEALKKLLKKQALEVLHMYQN